MCTSVSVFYTYANLELYNHSQTYYSSYILIFQFNVNIHPIKTKLQSLVERRFWETGIITNRLPNWISSSCTNEILENGKRNKIQILLQLISITRSLSFNLELWVIIIQSTFCWLYVFCCGSL